MSSSIIPAVLSELQSQYGITYEDAIQLQDENGDSHDFYIASMYEAKILVDTDGQLWMNEAELGRVIGVAKGTLHNAISRFLDTDLGRAISKVSPLYTLDRRGRKWLMNFYNEATIAQVVGGFKSHTPQAIAFIQEREIIITGIRKLMHNYSLNVVEQNFQLAAKLEDANAALQNQRFLTYEIDDLKQEINNRWLDELQERYPEEFED